nr:MAG TPA: hypothetical protein [Caudoviricetes sp.]
MELKEYITRIKSLNETKQSVAEEERLLSSPIVTDLSMVETVFQYCLDAYFELHPNNKLRHSSRRVLFVMMFIFSPKTLAGAKIAVGVRDKLAALYHAQPQNISYYVRNLMFFYNVYMDFQSDVDYIFAEVYKKLREYQ